MSAVDVHADVSGAADAPVVVLVNSLGTDHTMWDPQVAALAADHRVVRYDTRGHGRSPVPEGPYHLDDLGGDLVALLDRLDVARAAGVVGISLGGLTALWLAAHHPHRVERVVLANTAARVGTREGWEDRAALVRREGMGAVADAVIERFLSPGFRSADPDTTTRLRERLRSLDPEGYAACCEALATADLRAVAGEVAVPALIVGGTEDVATPVDDAQWLAGRLPHAELVVLPGAGHLSSIEQPEAFTGQVLAFLTEAAT
ncbi:MAG: 3-oxoadipate enol-lactonase [Actinobacteria bacterium]|nr:3-oxoadipate enol-lactonase [Actinomycetota bacterium]